MAKNTILGLDFGSYYLKAVLLERKKNRYELLGFSKVIQQRELISQSGEVEKELEIIKGCLKSFDLKSVNQVYFTFSNPSIIIRYFTLPEMPQNELKAALDWKIKKVVPFNIEQAYSYFFVSHLPLSPKENNVIYLAVLKPLLDEKFNLLKEAGLKVTAFGSAPLTAVEAYEDTFKQFVNETIVLVEIGHFTSNVVVVYQGQPRFSRVISTGGYHFEEALKTLFVSERGAIKFSDKECQEILYQEGIHEDSAEKQYKGIAYSQIIALFRPVLERLEIEIRRTIEYYKQNFESPLVRQIVFCGGGLAIKNLANYLAGRLELKIITAAEIGWLDFSEALAELKKNPLFLPENASVLGLIKGAEKITFSPFGALSRPAALPGSRFLKIGLGIFLAVLVSGFLVMVGVEKNFQNKIKSYNTKLSELDWVNQYFASLKTKPVKPDMSLLPYEVVRISKIFKFLGNELEDELVITDLAFDNVARTLKIKGMAFWSTVSPEENLADFMTAMKDSGIFGGARLISEKVRTDLSSKPIVFELEVTRTRS